MTYDSPMTIRGGHEHSHRTFGSIMVATNPSSVGDGVSVVGAYVTRPVAAENTTGIEQAPDRSPAPGAGQGAIESGARGDHLQPIYLDDLSYQPLTLIDTLTVTFADD